MNGQNIFDAGDRTAAGRFGIQINTLLAGSRSGKNDVFRVDGSGGIIGSD